MVISSSRSHIHPDYVIWNCQELYLSETKLIHLVSIFDNSSQYSENKKNYFLFGIIYSFTSKCHGGVLLCDNIIH